DALSRWRPVYLGAVKNDSVIAANSDVIAYPTGWRGRLAFGLLRVTGGSRHLRKLIFDAEPDLIHAHFGGDGWLVSRIAKKLGVPLVITLHGRDVTSQASGRGPLRARYRRNLRTAFARASLLLAVSDAIRDRAIRLGADPAKVLVHYTGVPMPGPADHQDDGWDVIFVGRFVPKKGVDDLIEALGTLTDLRPRALFIGTGPLEAAAREQAAALGLDATFVGAQPPEVVARYMTESKVFASPSKTAPDGDAEGLPTTILEAASMAVPTVSTRHSGIAEAVRDGETGLLGGEGDRAALAANLRALLTDDGLRTRLGDAARRHVAEHFDVVRQTRTLEDLFDAFAGAPGDSVAVGRSRSAGTA
ncbi:MAG TPA: glycosyltransferase, partial [Micromonosporaceae bacterium]